MQEFEYSVSKIQRPSKINKYNLTYVQNYFNSLKKAIGK